MLCSALRNCVSILTVMFGCRIVVCWAMIYDLVSTILHDCNSPYNSSYLTKHAWIGQNQSCPHHEQSSSLAAINVVDMELALAAAPPFMAGWQA